MKGNISRSLSSFTDRLRKGNITVMIRKLMHFSTLAAFFAVAGTGGCTGSEDQRVEGETKKLNVDQKGMVARVNGVPILDRQVRDLIDAVDGGLSEDEAIEALIRSELLASEARRRGWGSSWEAESVRRQALARTVLRKKIGEGVNAESLDKKKLRRYYEINKGRFVHGLQRRVVNIVALKGKDRLENEQAEKAAAEIAEQSKEVADEDGFKALAGPVIDKYKDVKIRVENLPPFTADDKRFVLDFVKAAHEAPEVGKATGVFKTEYGWHVIFVAEEIPAVNQSFEDVKDELITEVLPSEREMRASEFIDKLHEEGKVFIFEDNVMPKAASK